MLHRLFLLLAVFLSTPLYATPADDKRTDSCPMLHIVPERLPDLTIPRSGHSVFFAGGELTVAGGHTSHFVPVSTAEYLAEGKWHPTTMAYTHDNGFTVMLHSGEVLIGGGHTEELGVGQTFTLERYTPDTHTFDGFGCLDRRRVLANATQMNDGRVIISGNHYADDGIGCYNGQPQVAHLKDVRQGRSNPYILPIAGGEAVILGGNDQYDRHPDTVWVDRLKGDAFRVPLLEQWRLVYTDQPFSSICCGVGNYTYLLTATDSNGQLGIIEMRDTCFSLLPTVCPIPMQGPFGPVFYKGPVVVDSLRHRGYVMGVDTLYNRQYVLAIDYGKTPASLTLYYTDTLSHATITIPVVTPDGDVILAGGIPNNNYKPLATVWRYHFDTEAAAVPSAPAVPGWLLWVTVGIVAVIGGGWWYRRNGANGTHESYESHQPHDTHQPQSPIPPRSSDLIERICLLMDEQQPFCNSELKASDVAAALGTNSRYVTDCIKECRNMTFTQFINDYRIRYFQQLLRQNPDRKIIDVYTEAGFASERSFFRIFKETTGMTTSEWLSQNVGRQ